MSFFERHREAWVLALSGVALVLLGFSLMPYWTQLSLRENLFESMIGAVFVASVAWLAKRQVKSRTVLVGLKEVHDEIYDALSKQHANDKNSISRVTKTVEAQIGKTQQLIDGSDGSTRNALKDYCSALNRFRCAVCEHGSLDFSRTGHTKVAEAWEDVRLKLRSAVLVILSYDENALKQAGKPFVKSMPKYEATEVLTRTR